MPPEENAAAAQGGTPQTTPPQARGQQPAAESVDDILGDILKQPAPRGAADETEETDDAEPEDAAGGSEGDDAADPDAGDSDDSDDSGDADAGDAEEDDAAPASDEPDADTLKAARKAADEGDLDKAFQLAFGKKPEELQPNTKVWTAWRKANERRDAEIAKQQQAVAAQQQQGQAWLQDQQRQLQGVIEQLRPYDAYFQLEQRFAKDGDYSAIVQMVEHATKLSWDEAQKLILTKTRLSPGERQLKQKYEELLKKLEGQEQQKTEAQKKAEQEQAYQSDLATIRGQLSGEVAKVPRVAERIYAVLAKTRSPTGGLTLTIEEAGRRVLAAERRKLEKHPLLSGQRRPPPKNPKVSEAAATLAKARTGKKPPAPPLRRDSHGNGAIDEKTETIDDILGDILPKGGKRRAQ